MSDFPHQDQVVLPLLCQDRVPHSTDRKNEYSLSSYAQKGENFAAFNIHLKNKQTKNRTYPVSLDVYPGEKVWLPCWVRVGHWLGCLSAVHTLEDDACPVFILTLPVPRLRNRPAVSVDVGPRSRHLSEDMLHSVVDKIYMRVSQALADYCNIALKKKKLCIFGLWNICPDFISLAILNVYAMNQKS